MLRLALEAQLGVDAANSHYTIAGTESAPPATLTNDAAPSAATTPAAPAPNGIEELGNVGEDGGMYL